MKKVRTLKLCYASLFGTSTSDVSRSCPASHFSCVNSYWSITCLNTELRCARPQCERCKDINFSGDLRWGRGGGDECENLEFKLGSTSALSKSITHFHTCASSKLTHQKISAFQASWKREHCCAHVCG